MTSATSTNEAACPTSHEFSIIPLSFYSNDSDNNSPKPKPKPRVKTEAELFCESNLSFLNPYQFISIPIGMFYSICRTNEWTTEKIKHALILFCRYIYTKNRIKVSTINGAPIWDDKKVLTSYLDDKKICIFSEEESFNCKTNAYMDEKKALTDLLVKMLTVIFKLVHCFNPTLLSDTNAYFNELYKSVELYCHTIGFEHLGTPAGTDKNLYELFIRKLEIELNKCFPTPVIVQTCKPLEGYGCARLVTSTATTSGIKQIILLSKDNSGESNNPVPGGGHRARRSSKHLRTQKNRSRRNRS